MPRRVKEYAGDPSAAKASGGAEGAPLPRWIAPQLCELVKQAPEGERWAHEIKFDGYRMHARIERGQVRLLTRTGLDWSAKYPATIEALRALNPPGLHRRRAVRRPARRHLFVRHDPGGFGRR